MHSENISAPIYESLPLSLCLLLAVDMPPCSKNQSTASISQSTNKWAPAQASVSSARNAHTGHCFDRSPAVIFMGMIPPCLCVLLWMAPCVTFQSILKGYYVIMSLFHFPEMRENVDLSIYWRKVSVIISVLTLRFFLRNQIRSTSSGFLIARKYFSNYNIISVSQVRQWHHYPEYQRPSPEPSAPHHEKVLVTAPDCRW